MFVINGIGVDCVDMGTDDGCGTDVAAKSGIELSLALKRFFLLPPAPFTFCGDVVDDEEAVVDVVVVVISLDDIELLLHKLKFVIVFGSEKMQFHSDKSELTMSSGNDS